MNRYACDYLHGYGMVKAALPWKSFLTLPHVTLLDEAELTSFLGSNFPASATWGDMIARVADEGCDAVFLETVLASAKNWKSPIPSLPAEDVWIDNYISMVEYPHLEALNVGLLGPSVKGFLNPEAAHAYSHEWYGGSFERSPVLPVGLRLGAEFTADFPPTAPNRQEGKAWTQLSNLNFPDMGALDPLQLLKGVMVSGASVAVGKAFCNTALEPLHQ